MNMIRSISLTSLVALVVLAVASLSTVRLYADSCCSSGSKSKPVNHDNHQSYQQTYRPAQPEPPFQAPHGGQLQKTTWNYFEVVYGPQETRIYVYDTFRFPASARGMHGQVFMRVRSNGGEWKYPLQFMPVERSQDYLVANVDLTRVHDGDMDVYFDLAGIPNEHAPTARFANVFARPAVAGTTHAVGRAPLENDRELQAPPSHARYQSPQIVVAEATAADNAAIRTQGVCPVTNQPLGSHGNPTKILVDGRPVFVCCQGCTNKVTQNPAQYLAAAGR